MKKGNVIVSVTALLCLTLLELAALYYGLNGTVFSVVIVLIAGIAGYNFKSLLTK